MDNLINLVSNLMILTTVVFILVSIFIWMKGGVEIFDPLIKEMVSKHGIISNTLTLVALAFVVTTPTLVFLIAVTTVFFIMGVIRLKTIA